MFPTRCPRRYTATIGYAKPFSSASRILFLLLYCAPRYWRKRSVSVLSHVFCSSISTTRSFSTSPSRSRTVAAKSMRNIESVSRVVLLYSCGRTVTCTTSFFSKADSMVLAMRSSSMMYLNTES